MGIVTIRLSDGVEIRATYDDDALPIAGNDVSVSDGERERGVTALRAALQSAGRLGSDVDVSANVHFIQSAGDRRLATNTYSDTTALRNNGSLRLFRGMSATTPTAIPSGWAPMYNETDDGVRYTVYRGPERRDGDRTIPGRMVRIPLTGGGGPEVSVADGHGPGWCPTRLLPGDMSDIPVALPAIPDASYASSSANFWVLRGNRDGFTYFEGPGGQRSRRAIPTEYELAHPDPRRPPPRAEVFADGAWRSADEGDHVPTYSATAASLGPTLRLRVGSETHEIALTPAAASPDAANAGFDMFIYTQGDTTLSLRRTAGNASALFQIQRDDGWHEIGADGAMNPRPVRAAPPPRVPGNNGPRRSPRPAGPDFVF